MPAHRISDSTKQLRGTFHPSNSEARVTHGVAIVEPLPPPHDLTPRECQQWRLHMVACIAAGTLSHAHLLSFHAMVQVAAARAEAKERAMAVGVSLPDTHGGVRASPAWKAYMAADARYQTWAVLFGLAPAAGKNLPRLPPPKGAALREVK